MFEGLYLKKVVSVKIAENGLLIMKEKSNLF